eukprot:9363975-Alexandrium_andersonii.AAC.1
MAFCSRLEARGLVPRASSLEAPPPKKIRTGFRTPCYIARVDKSPRSDRERPEIGSDGSG